MKRVQYDRLATQHGDSFSEGHPSYFHRYGHGALPKPLPESVHLIPSAGRRKGKPGLLIGNAYGKLTLRFGAVEQEFHYTKVEFGDADGNPVIEPVLDMTGREIKHGSVVCYSISAGANSHACEIGKVTKLNPSGSVSVKPITRNGEKIVPTPWSRDRGSILPARALVLPVEVPMVTMWLLSDFENFKADEQ